ncbi:MAG: hydroxysqualene dehydroxylase HpnE [Burkholderiaceae bacterium]
MSRTDAGHAGPSPPRAAVVGAGWAGLASALTLARAGLTVELFEAAPNAGGRARTISLATSLGRFDVDNGQHLIVGAYRDSLALIDSLGATPRLERVSLALESAAGLRLRAARLPAPLHLAWALLTARGLGPGGRSAAFKAIRRLQQADWRVLPGETVAGLLARLDQPARLIERLWAPLCIGALNTLPGEACAATFVTVLRDTLGGSRSASDFMLADAPLGTLLPEPALARLQALGARTHLRTSVRRLERAAGKGWLIPVEQTARRFDIVVLALPPWASARLLTDSGLPCGRLSEFEAEPIATGWALWPADRSPALPRWQLLDEDPVRHHHGQWLFDRGFIDNGQARARLAGIVISLASRLGGLTSDVVAAGLADQLAAGPGCPPPAEIRVVTERRATFRCTPQRPRLRGDHLLETHPDLWLAGDWLWPDYPATLEAAVRSAAATADAILQRYASCSSRRE